MTIGLKWRFLKLESGFSLALKPEITLPTGNFDRELGSGKVSYGTALIATQEIEPFQVHANLSYERRETKFEGDDPYRHDILHASIAGTWEMRKGLVMVADVGMESNESMDSTTWPAFLLGGIIYSPWENFDIDLGIKGGLNKAEPDLSLMAGLTFRF